MVLFAWHHFLFKFINELIYDMNSILMHCFLHFRPITVDDLKKAITMADPEIDQKQMDVYLCWAFSVESKEKLDSTQSLELSFVIERLQNGLLKRVGKKT